MSVSCVDHSPIENRIKLNATAGEFLRFNIASVGGPGMISFTSPVQEFWHVTTIPAHVNWEWHPDASVIGTDGSYALTVLCLGTPLHIDVLVEQVTAAGEDTVKVNRSCDITTSGETARIGLFIKVF